ncbi:uncharacterized protein [Pempheris klunzingeri]|uniref:uncharacterized protein n=1 Tax=Pempheris klunzingeri TaxID=3127111 RepID=UPI003981783A
MELEPEVREEPFLHQQIRPEFHVQMDLEEETETGQELEERHIDMERKHEMVAEPVMELEPLDDDDDDDMFREVVSNTEQGLMRKRDHVLDEEPIMQLEPEVREEHQMPPSEEYFPNEEARMRIRMERRKQKQRLNYLMMEEPGSEFVWGEESSSVMDGPVFVRQEVQTPVEGEGSPATWQSYRSCVTHEGKCYQFFKGPKSAPEAEFFCQEHFSGGHLASITSPNIHRELMNMMLAQNGAYTRSWIGGLRYLETGRFIWLDGSQWSYADWLSGEPNNTADMEDCVEVLAVGNGKFNDFTCRERQAFICSYPYQ